MREFTMHKYLLIALTFTLLAGCNSMNTGHSERGFNRDGNPERSIVQHSHNVTRNAADAASVVKP